MRCQTKDKKKLTLQRGGDDGTVFLHHDMSKPYLQNSQGDACKPTGQL